MEASSSTDPTQLRAKALMDLVEQHLPVEYEVTGDQDAWPLVGVALLSRLTSMLEAIMKLQDQDLDVDAGTLLRSLYEHVVHLAWLAADPSETRIKHWRYDDLKKRLTTARDAADHGIQLMTEDEQDTMESEVQTLAVQLGVANQKNLVIEQMADAADNHWAGRLPGMGPRNEAQSFDGLYALLYRHVSGTAHPSFRGINPVVEEVSPTRCRVVRRPAETWAPYGTATIVYGLALYVAAESMAWPKASDVDAVFDQWPSEVF
jgi:hypothetical protein